MSEHGNMDIEAHKQSFAVFTRLFTFGTLAAAAILIFLAILVAY
ncbi:aa3-type cytochrome c oxidase subunit IV [Sneathiella sp.]